MLGPSYNVLMRVPVLLAGIANSTSYFICGVLHALGKNREQSVQKVIDRTEVWSINRRCLDHADRTLRTAIQKCVHSVRTERELLGNPLGKEIAIFPRAVPSYAVVFL